MTHYSPGTPYFHYSCCSGAMENCLILNPGVIEAGNYWPGVKHHRGCRGRYKLCICEFAFEKHALRGVINLIFNN